ncbi:MAG: methyltransferase [Methylococcales bacterium]
MNKKQDRKKQHDTSNVLWDIIAGAIGYRAVFVAYELGLFELLGQQPRSLTEVSELLNIAERPTEALLLANLSLELLQRNDDLYALTETAEHYLLKESSTYFGGIFDMITHNPFSTSVESLKDAVLSNSPQTYGGNDIFLAHEEQIEQAKAFTRGMHSISVEPAFFWPDLVDLSDCHCLLDVGGGSGAHAIGALNRWSHLMAIVYDIKPVCEVAEEHIQKYQLQKRMSIHPGDMWKSPYPSADIHFYSQIFHDWPIEKCRFLAQKSFESLPDKGKIIIHEILYHNDKSGPFIAAASSVAMLVWSEGQQFSGLELTEILSETGFINIDVTPSSGYWSIVSGEKP